MLTIILLALIPLACNMPTSNIEATTTPASAFGFLTLTAQAAPLTPAYTETPDLGQPTATLAPGITPSPTVCTFNASFVSDVTVPDGTQILAGMLFDKTWRVRNNGCLDWPNGTELVFFSGEHMSGPSAVLVPSTAVDNTVDITASLRAPTTPGEYTGYWQLQTPDNVLFGPNVFITIVVVAGTATPNVTLTPTPTVTATTLYQPFIGNWVNQSADSGGISQVQIQVVENVIIAHMWTKCAPTDCDYGSASTPALDANDGELTLNWVKENYTEVQHLTILLDGRLQMNGQVSYVDPKQQAKNYTYFFARTDQ